MDNTQTIEVAKVLLRHIGENPKQDEALAQGVIVILESMDLDEPAPDPKPAPKQTKHKPEQKPEPKKRTPFDVGKLRSLYNGGWSAAMIADEMDVSEQTVRNYAKKEGLRFGKTNSV